MAKITGAWKIKDGKLIKRPTKKSVSQRIAEKKRPKQRYRAAGKISV
jgi:hypothetical protein